MVVKSSRKVPKKYDMQFNKRMDYEMEKIMRKNLRRFENMLEKTISEQLKNGILFDKNSGFNPKDFGQSQSQFWRNIGDLFK